MSRNVKYSLLLVGAVFILCCGGAIGTYFVGRALLQQVVATTPEEAARIGRQIADYDLPVGYREQIGMNMGAIKMVMIAPESTLPGLFISLMQFQAGTTDVETMRAQMEQSLTQQTGSQSTQMEVVGTEDVTIKGETVTLTIREGKTENGDTLRQVTGIFPGKDGPAMLMLMGSADNWDEEAVDSFITSIR